MTQNPSQVSQQSISESREDVYLRLALPFRQLTHCPTGRQTVAEVLIASLVSIAVASAFASDRLFGVGPFVAFLILVLGAGASIEIVSNYRYLRAGMSRSEVLLGDFEILIAELKPFRRRRFRFDALAICRLRVIVLPDFFTNYDSEKITEPVLWRTFATKEAGRFALVAEDVNGRRMFSIAVAYPREVMFDLAKRVKAELDSMRAAHHADLLKQNPGIVIPQTSRSVPICVGDKFSLARANAKKPETTRIQLRTIGEKTEIVAPRGHQLEMVRIRAHRNSVLIERQLLLGKIQDRIAAEYLLAIRAQGTEGETSDSAELVIEYRDTDQAQLQRVVLLQGFTIEEVAWVAAELLDACPPLGKPDERPKRTAIRFSMAQIMFLTALAAAICSPFALSRQWGWLYAIQLSLILFCVVSFSGAKSLGRITRRSWTMSEIIIGAFCLLLLSVIRLVAFLNGN